MAVIPEAISLKPLEEIRGIQRYQVGVDLANAVASNDSAELGSDAKDFKHAFVGVFMLGRAARKAADAATLVQVVSITESWPYPTIQPHNILKDNTVRPRASGVARAKYCHVAPFAIERIEQTSTRFDYWLRQAREESCETQSQLGAAVLATLVRQQEQDHLVWSAVSPYDTAKAAALQMTGFEMLEDPGVYHLDGRDVARQIWHKRVEL